MHGDIRIRLRHDVQMCSGYFFDRDLQFPGRQSRSARRAFGDDDLRRRPALLHEKPLGGTSVNCKNAENYTFNIMLINCIYLVLLIFRYLIKKLPLRSAIFLYLIKKLPLLVCAPEAGAS